MKDEYAVVLDFLEHGKAGGKEERLVQAIGKKNFNLLELVAREGKHLKSGEEIYIGDDEREEIKFIKGRITMDDLTGNAKGELDYILDDLIEENEEKFIKFFNSAGPISTRQHSVELLPNVGKKHMWKIVDQRDIEKFKSFDDIKEKVELLPDPRKLIKKRLKKELKGGCKRYIFVDPPRSEDKNKRIRYD